MSRILIDLTDLELWSGHHGGTQRVVYSISKYFFLEKDSLKDDIEFISFSSADKSFHHTDFAQIYDRVEALKSTPSSVTAPQLTYKSRIKSQLRHYVPESIKRSDSARKALAKSIALATKVANARRRAGTSLSAGASSGAPVSFTPDDIVLVMGKPWDNLDIQDTIASSKQKHDFKVVQVIYDLIISLQPQLHHPSLFVPYTQNMFETVTDSDVLLPISECSARDLKTFCDELNLDMPKVEVIRLGDEIIDGETNKPKEPAVDIEDKFILCVGTVEIRKNHILLYYAYKLGLQKKLNLPQLIIVGSRGWLSGDFQYLVENDPEARDKIVILDNISDTELDWLYGNCLFSVYPSMYEGWGLPVAESLARGKFCLASNASSIPEIGGDLIDYFSPYNANQFLELLVKYLDNSLVKNKEQKIKSTYKTVSWKDTYNQVYKLVKSLTAK